MTRNRIVNLGDKARDRVTGFEGIVTGYHEWITGCDTVTLTPPVDKDGKERESKGSYDVNRVEVIKAGAVKIEKVTVDKDFGKASVGG
jgi:hypothetical protein